MVIEILRKIFSFLVNSIQIILVLASVLMILYAFVLQPNEVSGNSMHPTFKNKELLFSYLLAIRSDSYTRGDVVVFHSQTEDDKRLIKRIIALPGDRVMVLDGAVYLNGAPLDETAYLDPSVRTGGGAFLQDGIEMTVPEGAVVVMGDNRPGSSDSREWGFLRKEMLVGKSIIRFWPLSTFTFIQNPFK